MSYRGPPSPGRARLLPSPAEKGERPPSRVGSQGQQHCPARLGPAIPASRTESVKPPTAAAQGLENRHRSPFASGQLPGFTRPAGCQEKVSQRAGHWPLGPKHAEGTSAPQLLSVPRWQRSRDPHRARGLHRFPRHHPGSPTRAGPPHCPAGSKRPCASTEHITDPSKSETHLYNGTRTQPTPGLAQDCPCSPAKGNSPEESGQASGGVDRTLGPRQGRAEGRFTGSFQETTQEDGRDSSLGQPWGGEAGGPCPSPQTQPRSCPEGRPLVGRGTGAAYSPKTQPGSMGAGGASSQTPRPGGSASWWILL